MLTFNPIVINMSTQDDVPSILKKKSRFDIAPPEWSRNSVPDTAGPVQVADSVAKALESIRNSLGQTSSTSVPSSSSSLSSSSFITGQLPMWSLATPPPYVSVNAGAFQDRLDKALQKNLDYIKRKDLLVSQGLWEEKKRPDKPIREKVHSVFNANHHFGIGSDENQHHPQNAHKKQQQQQQPSGVMLNECMSIYVSGLPLDFTQEELEILFSQQGKIKKSKLYTDRNGKLKGDALITFYKAELVTSACVQFNGLDIGDGYVISVVKADFGTGAGAGGNGNNSSDGKLAASYYEAPINTNTRWDIPSVFNANESDSTAGHFVGGGGGGSCSISDSTATVSRNCADWYNEGGGLGSSICAKSAQPFANLTTSEYVLSEQSPVISITSSSQKGLESLQHLQAQELKHQQQEHESVARHPHKSNTTTIISKLDALCFILPTESEAGKYPVVLVSSAFDPTALSTMIRRDPGNASDFLQNLETDMLLECCAFGNVKSLLVLTDECTKSLMTDHIMAATAEVAVATPPLQSNYIESMKTAVDLLNGSFAVSFEDSEAALTCCTALKDKTFEGRILTTMLLDPQYYLKNYSHILSAVLGSNSRSSTSSGSNSGTVSSTSSADVGSNESVVTTSRNDLIMTVPSTVTSIDEVEGGDSSLLDGVDDFLNSLL